MLEQYKALPNADEYSWTIWSIGNWLYLADVWKHQGIVVLEALESTTLELVKSRNRRLVGPKRGKAGRAIADEDV